MSFEHSVDCLKIIKVAEDIAAFAEAMAEIESVNKTMVDEALKRILGVIASMHGAMETVH